jgi:hypothetical protein
MNAESIESLIIDDTPKTKKSDASPKSKGRSKRERRMYRKKAKTVHEADLARTPSPDVFSFRPLAEEDNAPTEREEVVIKNMAADQLSVKSEDDAGDETGRGGRQGTGRDMLPIDEDDEVNADGDTSKVQNMIAMIDPNQDLDYLHSKKNKDDRLEKTVI